MRKYNSSTLVAFLFATIIAVAAIALSSAITMWLWNWIAVGLFSLPIVGFWEAFGIMMLCSFLFKGGVSIRSKRG